MFSVQQVEITSTQCRYNRSREPCLWLVVAHLVFDDISRWGLLAI